MKPEDQVSNRELSERLKELGVKQESLFYWIERTGYPNGLLVYAQSEGAAKYQGKVCASAFTVAELGEMLLPYRLPDYQTENKKWVGGWNNQRIMEHMGTESDARAKMLIYLIEQGLVKP